MALNEKMQKTIDYEDRIISEEVRRKMDDAVAKAEAEGIEVESEYYTGSDLDKMKEFARLNDIGVITGPFADYGRGVNVPRTPTLFNLFAMEEELSHNRQPEDPNPKKGSRPTFKAGPSKRLLNLKGMYDEEVRAKDEALEKTGGLLPKAKRTAELTRESYAEMFKNGINRYVKETGDIETIKELFKQYPELRNVEEIKYPEGGLPFKQGGVVPMNNMAKQMEMFDDGGLMDEGGTVDPVSGNDVPPGSNQEEVRDDIPAQLSEGEFVFPADVVRFIGLEKLMMIRQRAKAGLQRMEDMGQMGNSEEAVMPDDLPFSIEDLDMEDDELEMAQGGVVHMANGGTYNVPDPSAGVYYNPAGSSTTGVAAAPMKAASASAAPNIGQAATPVEAGSGKTTMFTDYELPQAPVPVMTAPDQRPKFLGEVTPGVGGVDYVNEVYENEAGETETFRRYTDGRLLDENGAVAVIPEGYKIKSEAEKDVGTGPVKVETATVQDDGGDGGGNQDDVTTGTTMSFGGNLNSKGSVDNAIRGSVSYRGSNYGTGLLGTGGIKDFPDMMGRLRSSGLHQLTGGKSGTPMSFKPGETMIISNLVQSRPGVNNSFELANIDLEVDADFYNNYISGKTTTGKVELARVANYVNDNYKGLAPGSVISASQTLSQIELEDARAAKAAKVQRAQETGNYDEVIADAIQDAKDYSESADKSSVTGVDDEAFDAGYGKGTPAAPSGPSADTVAAADAAGPIGYEPGGGYNNDDNGRDNSGSGGADAGGFGTGAGEQGGLSHAKGGLVSQMKRSGLASKK